MAEEDARRGPLHADAPDEQRAAAADGALAPEEHSESDGALSADAQDGQPGQVTREDVYRVLIGPKYPVMLPRVLERRPFNAFAFLFGPYYYFYRKMYRAGLVWLVISYTVNILQRSVLGPGPVTQMPPVDALILLLVTAAPALAQAALFYRLYGIDLHRRYEQFEKDAPDDGLGRLLAFGELRRSHHPTSTLSVVALLAFVLLANRLTGGIGAFVA